MRKNAELKKEWQHKIRFCDEYNIEIFMMYSEGGLTLNVALELDGIDMIDYECVMVVENVEEPTSEMKKKFKSLVKYFGEHFENVQGNEKVLTV